MPISRGQMPRQMYGLGSLVKSITKGAKSAVKGITSTFKENPLLGLAALNFAPMLAGAKPFIGMGSLAGSKYTIPGISSIMGSLGLDVAPGAKPTLGQFAKVFTIGSLGGAALEALTASGADEEDLKNIRDVDTLKAYMRDGYMKLNPGASPMQVDRFVEGQTYEYRANGGRIGFADGMPREGIETLLPKPKPSEMMQGVDKTIQSIDNFAQLIAQSGSPSDMRGHMDLFSDFIQKNNVDAGPAFQYLKNRVKELKPGMERYIYISNEDMPVQKAMGGRINYSGGSNDFQKWLEGKQQFDQKRNAEELYKEYLEQKRREKVMEQKTMAANGGRIGFFKGAQADARAGKGAMSPGTSMSGGFRGGGDGGGNRNNTGPASTLPTPPTPKISTYEKIKALGTVPLNLIGGLFGNPFDPTRPHQVINTKAQIDYLNNLANQKGTDSGVLSYGDYGTKFNLSDLKNPIAFSTAMTMGGTGYKKTDTGDITYTGGTYDFDGAVPFIDQGGLMGMAYKGGEYLANKFNPARLAYGGRPGYAFGSPEENAMKASGIGGLPLNQNPAGITELDLRDSGGFIPPVGVKEKADDIPAMLSNNEFVFTADAVRGMGDGDVEKGAQRMYDMMKKLENGGRV